MYIELYFHVPGLNMGFLKSASSSVCNYIAKIDGRKVCFQKLGRLEHIQNIPVKLREVEKPTRLAKLLLWKVSQALQFFSPEFVLFLSPGLSITACKTLPLKDLKVHSKAMQLF